ncbi:MAG: hypothetical protein LBV36_03645 [Chromatiales bacterium]|nr:hypothetical protein [Chromatiales bacterium]
MSAIEKRSIVISNNAGATSVGTLYVKQFGARDRVLRALAALGLVWLLAVLAILIPGLHFVLVPALLIAGPVVAFRRFRITAQNERATGACPSCGKEFSLALDSDDPLPLSTYCPPSDDPIQLLDGSDATARA